MTHGAEGAEVVTASGDHLHVKPEPLTEVVDTVGAGDAFAAALIRGRLAGWDWWRSTRFASASGAIQVTRHGCSAVFPTAADVADTGDFTTPVDVTGVDIARLQRWQTNRPYLTERSVELLGRLHSTGSWPNSSPTTARDVRRSPLHDRLAAAGARCAESSGWENATYFAPTDADIEFRYTYGRPDWFGYHAAEHRAVRNDVALPYWPQAPVPLCMYVKNNSASNFQ